MTAWLICAAASGWILAICSWLLSERWRRIANSLRDILRKQERIASEALNLAVRDEHIIEALRVQNGRLIRRNWELSR